jgi:hypothetical protein
MPEQFLTEAQRSYLLVYLSRAGNFDKSDQELIQVLAEKTEEYMTWYVERMDLQDNLVAMVRLGECLGARERG